MRHLSLLGFLLLVYSGLSGQTLRWNTPGGDVQAKSPAATSLNTQVRGQEVETGYVTYYADYLVGQPTASGEFYSHELLTAAHRTLPFGTLLKVTRLDNNASVVVRVNDRGTLCNGCVLSISRGAAEALNMVKSGKITVAVQEAGFSNVSPRQENQLTARGQFGAPVSNPESYDTRTYAYGGPASSTASAPAWDPKYDDPTARRMGSSPTTTGTYSAPNQAPPAYGAQPRPNNPTLTARSASSGTYEPGTDYTRRPATSVAPSNQRPAAPMEYNGYVTPSPARADNSAAAARVSEVQIAANVVQGYGIQLGAFGNFANAERRVVSLQEQGLNNVFIKQDADGKLSRVIVGPFASNVVAKAELQRLETELGLRGLVMNLR